MSGSKNIGTRRRLAVASIVVSTVSLVAVGVFARNGWFPRTDALSGERTGWFGQKLPRNAASSWNPFAAPSPTPTPQLSKEYLYAGSRLLAVEDANANAAPPADLAIWRPSTGYWWVYDPNGSNHITAPWGQAGDTPVAGDFDGDGITDFSIFRPSTGAWWVYRSSDSTSYSVTFGQSGDITAPADLDGDGRSDLAVFRGDDPSSGFGTWYVMPSAGSGYYSVQFGLSSDIPAPADHDGDGIADITVFRASNETFYSYLSSDNTTATVGIGAPGTPASGDYDGDGRANYAVKNGNAWHILTAFPNIVTGSGTPQSSESVYTVSWQDSGDLAVQNDYDADSICDIAVWRPTDSPSGTLGYWYIRQSSKLGVSGQSPTSGNPFPNELRQVQWGTTGDIPIPAYYRR